MSEVRCEESEIEVFSRIVRALAHRIRGDLSVITNDLAYIATLLDPRDVERARQRCAQISQGLGAFSALSGVEVNNRAFANVSLTEVLELFGFKGSIDSRLLGVSIKLSKDLMQSAVALLQGLMGSWNVTVSTHKLDTKRCIELSLSTDLLLDFSDVYSSLAAFSLAQLGERAVIEAGVVDLILRDHGWPVAVVSQDRRVVLRMDLLGSYE